MVFLIECRSYIVESMDIDDTPDQSNRHEPLQCLYLYPKKPASWFPKTELESVALNVLRLGYGTVSSPFFFLFLYIYIQY